MTPRLLTFAILLFAAGVAAVCAPEFPLVFKDVASDAGVRATMRCGGPEKRWIPEANGSGAAWIDYDNDGFPDLLIVNGGTMDQLRRTLAGEKLSPTAGSVYLYHNLRNGHFEDVSARSGLQNPYWGTGVNTADFNNDGLPDVLITSIGSDLLYKNNGDGTFTDVSRAAGLRDTVAWHTGSAFGDFDGDGKVDLFITGYIDLHSMSWNDPAPVCDYNAQHVFCGPLGLKGEHSVLYHNNGDGTFTDVSKNSGIAQALPAHGFTPVAADFNGDGKLDIFVANDSDPNYLFINKGNGTFEEQALDHGVAVNADGRAQSNMGVAIGSYGASRDFDLLTTVFNKDYFPLFRLGKSGSFEEVSSSAGLTAATGSYLGWACGLADFENSGSNDLWTANGHVYPTDPDYFEPLVIFRSMGTKSEIAFSYPTPPNNSYRGAAMADFDNDGRVDLVVLPISGAPLLLKNEKQTANHWLGIALHGTKSGRDAIGAVVSMDVCGRTQSSVLVNGGSYLSHNDSRLHFGLGSCTKVDHLVVTWPGNHQQEVSASGVDRYVEIVEAK